MSLTQCDGVSHCTLDAGHEGECETTETKALKAERETLEIKLAACTNAALSNTAESIQTRLTRENPYWTATYGDVCAAVDREMALRAERDALAKRWDALNVFDNGTPLWIVKKKIAELEAK